MTSPGKRENKQSKGTLNEFKQNNNDNNKNSYKNEMIKTFSVIAIAQRRMESLNNLKNVFQIDWVAKWDVHESVCVCDLKAWNKEYEYK